MTGDNPHHSLCVLSTQCEYLIVFPLFRMFLSDPTVNLCVGYRVVYILVVGSGPVKTSFLACLASLSAILFPFISVWPVARKLLVDSFLPVGSGSDNSRTLTSRWLCTLQGSSMAFLLSVPICWCPSPLSSSTQRAQFSTSTSSACSTVT